MGNAQDIVALIAQRQDVELFRKKMWQGSFDEYLDIVRKDPRVTRNSFERLYDMIMSYGVDQIDSSRGKKTRFRFFSDPDNSGHDAVYGLDRTLGALVNAFKSAAKG